MSTLNGLGERTREIKTADYTVVSGTDNGKTFTNEGASGAVVFSLPAATVGQWYRFKCKAGQALRVDPNGTETIALASTGVQGAAGKYLGTSTAGEGFEIECVKAGAWEVNSYVGSGIAQEA